ncbi:MAG: GPI anchored serine-threonine rich family protein, partial [Phycisphaerae bacterium]|nr:GPI anchored serine-threonine rich family protein [Phycisphaerae bacterium]
LQVRVKVAQSGITSMTAKISFDAESFGLIDNFRFDDPSVLTVYQRQTPGQGLFVQLPTSYNPVTKQLSTTMTEFGELIFCFPDIEDVPYAPMLIETESYRGIQEYMVIAAQMAEPNEQYPVNQELPILLSWTPKGFARSYHLQVAKDENFNNIVVEETFLKEARYIFKTAEHNMTYYYRVNTTNEGGTSGWSVGSFATVPPMIEVTAPNGREQWKRGLEYFIKWYDNIAEDVVIELYKGDTLVRTIGMVLSDRAYEWEVDLDLEPGCDYSIKIKSSTDETLFDMSDGTFAIDPPDTTPPEFELSVTPTMLWPPTHKMVLITPSWTVSDDIDPSPDVSLVSIVANEGDNIIGDGHTSDDIQIGEDGSIYLRSERSGTGSSRIYTITYEAVDDCGNVAVSSATVSIPHDFRLLARIASRWLWTGAGRIPEDLNGDGSVNLADIANFADNWIGVSSP